MGARRAGYLLLRGQDGTFFITEAVDEGFRRAGVASGMIGFAQRAYGDLTAEILLTNAASIALHQRAGFERVGDDGRVAVYRFRKASV